MGRVVDAVRILPVVLPGDWIVGDVRPDAVQFTGPDDVVVEVRLPEGCAVPEIADARFAGDGALEFVDDETERWWVSWMQHGTNVPTTFNVTAMAGTYIVVANDDDSMNMVGHHHEGIEGDVWEMFWDGSPAPFDDAGDGWIFKGQLAAVGADRDEVRAGGCVIPGREAQRGSIAIQHGAMNLHRVDGML